MKRTAERILGSPPVLALASLVRPSSAVILAYHNVIDLDLEVAGDRSLHLRLDGFLNQIDWLTDNYPVIPLDQLLEDREDSTPVAVITFDDAYRGAVRTALPELTARNLPATVFACSGWLGGEVPWWDSLGGHEGLSANVREVALEEHRGRESAIMKWASRQGFAPSTLPTDYSIASFDELVTAIAGSRITVGSHTHSHPNLPRLAEASLRLELRRSFEVLADRFEAFVPWLAYPYGRVDERVWKVAAEVGYAGALRVKGGPVRRRAEVNRFSIPRVYVPSDITLANLRLRLAGWV